MNNNTIVSTLDLEHVAYQLGTIAEHDLMEALAHAGSATADEAILAAVRELRIARQAITAAVEHLMEAHLMDEGF